MGFSKQDARENLVADLLPVIFPLSAFCWSFWCKRLLGKHESYLSYSQKSSSSTFLHDISPTKERNAARVRNPQGISKLVNKVDCCLSYDSFWMIPKHNLHLITFQWVPHAWLKAIVQAFLTMKSFAAGSSTYPYYMAASQSQSQGTSYLWETVFPNGTEAPWMWSMLVRADHSASLSCVLQGFEARAHDVTSERTSIQTETLEVLYAGLLRCVKKSFLGTAFACGFLVEKGT